MDGMLVDILKSLPCRQLFHKLQKTGSHAAPAGSVPGMMFQEMHSIAAIEKSGLCKEKI
jgi:hypothetical protein